jgi:hypothetical protein
MKSLRRWVFVGIVLALGPAVLLSVPCDAQVDSQASFSSLPDASPALVRSVRISPARENGAVEIITTRPLIPSITPLENPARLVIDLQNSTIAAPQRLHSAGQISSVRVSQFQKDPPVTRVVIDLAHPTAYNWDEAGNRLMIRLQGEKPATVSQVPVTSAEPRGQVVLAGLRTRLPVFTNSSISAGVYPATLHLPQGGQVRVCPGTTVSVTASQNGRDMTLGMSTGALETHYQMQPSADSVLTPDFRIAPSGTGEFAYAISSDSRGDTCVRALPGTTASAVVSELMGEGVYQVKPSEQALFRNGRVAGAGNLVPSDCGCPSGPMPVLRTAAVPPGTGDSATESASGVAPESSGSPETAALPPTQSQEAHVQVDAPFVFRASDTPTPVTEAENLPLDGSRRPNLMEVTVNAPAAAPERKGIFARIGGFFSRLFR